MLGLSHPTEGSLEVCGVDVAADPIAARSRLGYMPEHDCLPLDQTAADVVATFGELSGLPARAARQRASDVRSEEHPSELQSLMRLSYAVFCLKKKKHKQ